MHTSTRFALAALLFAATSYARPWELTDSTFTPTTETNTLTLFGTNGSPVSTIALTYTPPATTPAFNRGPLPTFTAPASCSQLSALLLKTQARFQPNDDSSDPTLSYTTYKETYSEEDAVTTATVLGEIYTETRLFGAGYAWYLNNGAAFIGDNAAATRAPDPVSPCFPKNYFDDANGMGWEEVSAFYSPAVACPTGWAIASTTTLTTKPAGAKAVVKETAALCCPSGWAGDEFAYGCTSVNPDGAYTVAAAMGNVEGRLKPTNVIFTDSPETAIYPATELSIEIRWQASDLKASTSKSGGVASHGGPVSRWVTISASCAAVFVAGAAFLL